MQKPGFLHALPSDIKNKQLPVVFNFVFLLWKVTGNKRYVNTMSGPITWYMGFYRFIPTYLAGMWHIPDGV